MIILLQIVVALINEQAKWMKKIIKKTTLTG
jgi:hypothetical protein